MRSIVTGIGLGLAGALLAGAARAEEPPARIFPFPMEGAGLWSLWDGGARRAPAGAEGFIRAKGNHFVDGTGAVRRFLGVNLYGPAQLPERAVAERTAKLLSWWGVNAVRLFPQYAWQLRKDRDFSKGIDPALLDRFDYLFAQLKARGVYATVNLHSARTAGYHFPDFRQTMKENKGLDNFDPTFICHQKDFIRAFFDHVNPYTGLAYRDEPAVMSWEVNNECALPIAWFTWGLWEKMTPPFRAELTRQFNAWLKEKYGTTEALRAAWRAESPLKGDVVDAAAWTNAAAFARENWYTEGYGRGGQGPRAYRLDPAAGAVAVDATQVRKFARVGVPLEAGEVYAVSLRIRSEKPGTAVLKVGQHGRPYGGQGVKRTLATGPDWREVRVCTAARVSDADNRVQIEFKTRGAYELAGLSVVRGGAAGLGADETLEAATVVPSAEGSAARARDVSAFIFDAEDRYWREMVRYVKEEMKARAPVNAGTFDYGAGYAQAHGDFIDNHFYYRGLVHWPGRAWDARNWTCANESLVLGLDARTEKGLASRVFGRPFTVSEANQMHQMATAADFFPIYLSLAAFQDYAAVHAYTWTHAPSHAYGATRFFDLHGNAKSLAHWPAARNMFVRGDVKSGFSAPARIVYDVGRAEERAALHRTDFVCETHVFEMDPLAALKAATGLRYVDLPRGEGVPTCAATPRGRPAARERAAVSSTGELAWDAADPARARYAVDTPRTKFASLFGPAGTVCRFRDGTAFTLGETLMGWAALSLTETRTDEWLLAATGYQQPTGAVLQVAGEKAPLAPADGVKALGRRITTCAAMGNVPFLCEGVRASVRLPLPKGGEWSVLVTPLDGDGRAQGAPFFAACADGVAAFEISETHRTLWYRVVRRPCNLPAFGEPIPGSGYDPSKPDCGMRAAALFDRPPPGLSRLGALAAPAARDVPETSAASIGFEGLDRRLFEPTAEVYERLGACGVKWARVQTMWSRCERERGVYDFSELDAVVDGLRAVGIRPWFSVTFGNALYMSNCYTKAAVGCVPLYYGAACRAAWLAYVRALARRYRGKVSHWEVWNEANLACFWQPRAPDARDYLELVKITGEAIRSAFPEAKIGAGSSDSGLRDWGRAFFEAGGGALIDFWCGHAYGAVPERFRGQQRAAGKGEEPDFVREMAWVRRFLDAHGARHVEIWQGESGFPSWFPANHWLFPKGVCQEGWQSEANQAKWLLRRWLTDRRAGLARSSFYQACDITRRYSMATTTQAHPAEHGVLDGWTKRPKMSYFALGHWNALFASAAPDGAVPVAFAPAEDAGAKTLACAFRTAAGAAFFAYYAPFDFSRAYEGRAYAGRTDARLAVPAAEAPADPVLVDLLRGGVYACAPGRREGDRAVFENLPLVDYPLVLAPRAAVPVAGARAGD